MQGWSHFEPTLAGFGFAYVAVLAFAPLPLRQLSVLLGLGLAVSMTSAYATGFPTPAENPVTHYAPAVTEVCGIECDVVGFSAHCEKLPVKVVVSELRRFGKVFDDGCLARGVEPLKSWGDSRIAVAGLPRGTLDEQRIPEVDAVLAMLEAMTPIWPARIGLHCGPVMMAVMDGARLSFDIWGETVNIAARLEQGAATGTMLVSEKLLLAARGLFDHGAIREIQVKKTVVKAAELIGIRPEYRDQQGSPNEDFWEVYRKIDYATSYPDPNGIERLVGAAGRNK